MGIVNAAEEWIMNICVKRGVTGAVKALSAYAASDVIGRVLVQWGISIDWDRFQIAAILLVGGLLSMLHDYLKVKKGIAWL